MRHHRQAARQRRNAFTLLEVLLVLAILVILGGTVGVYFAQVQGSAYSDVAKQQIETFEGMLEMYRMDTGRYPSEQSGLEALRAAPGASGDFAATPQDRINPDGSITRRNLGEKDNEFNSLDIRLAKNFNVGGFTIQPILDVFNVFNEANFLRPQVTNLIFNFDGTVRSGAGQPRQFQLGLRFLF